VLTRAQFGSQKAEGTLDFTSSDAYTADIQLWSRISYVYTDECLAAAGLDGETPEERCLGISSDKIECTYEPDTCECDSVPLLGVEGTEEQEYAADGDQLMMYDMPPGTYCVEDDTVTMLFHAEGFPEASVYWVLHR